MEFLPLLVVAVLLAVVIMVLFMGDREQDVVDAPQSEPDVDDDEQRLNTRSRDP